MAAFRVYLPDDGELEVVGLGLSETSGRRGKASTIRRDGAGQMSASGFSAVSGGFQGNFEEDEQTDELGDSSGASFDWTQCQSEGGDKNCALCSDIEGGALPCDKVPVVKKHGESKREPYSACSDGKQLSNRKFWRPSTKGDSRCAPMTDEVALQGIVQSTREFPGLGNHFYSLVTKAWVTHPNKAHEKVGVYMFKRVVTHKCTGKYPEFCQEGVTVVDVYKTAICVKCDYKVFPHTRSKDTNETHRISFVDKCLPKAVNKNTEEVEKNFLCSDSKDASFAEATVTAY